MTNEQIIERLATEVMGFVKKRVPTGWGWWDSGKGEWQGLFDPTTDWNHYRQVEERILQMPDSLFSEFVLTVLRNQPHHVRYSTDTTKYYLKATLDQRCQALLSALDSLPSK